MWAALGINYNTSVSRSEEFLRRRRSQRGHPKVMAKPGYPISLLRPDLSLIATR
uniref:Uncharacterized protein n=1 Tax=Fagus sylvatica TaxID=28930 RepID=A0A2N9EFH8_FAGSY